jgi:hypothetical protein
MAGETDWTLLATGYAIAANAKTVSCAESDTVVASTSSNVAAEKIEKKDVHVPIDYWKKSWVTETYRVAYHVVGWLPGGVESSISDLEFLTVDNSTVVCFESHLMAVLGLPPSTFLVSVPNFLRCELVHLNPNAITALSCFTMLCECWLGIAPDTSLF